MLSRHVIIPIGDETKPLSCPVCFYPFRTEFLQDEEEWVWTNAMKDGETVSILYTIDDGSVLTISSSYIMRLAMLSCIRRRALAREAGLAHRRFRRARGRRRTAGMILLGRRRGYPYRLCSIPFCIRASHTLYTPASSVSYSICILEPAPSVPLVHPGFLD